MAIIGPGLPMRQTPSCQKPDAAGHGEFEIIYGGAAGAMQPMGGQFDQDQILRIVAFVKSLPPE